MNKHLLRVAFVVIAVGLGLVFTFAEFPFHSALATAAFVALGPLTVFWIREDRAERNVPRQPVREV